MKIKFYTNKGRTIIVDFDLQDGEKIISACHFDGEIIKDCPFRKSNRNDDPWCTYPDGKKKYFPKTEDWPYEVEVTCDWNANDGNVIPGTDIEMIDGCPRIIPIDCGIEEL